MCSQWTNNRRLLHTCQLLRTRGWVDFRPEEWVEGDGFVIFSVHCCVAKKKRKKTKLFVTIIRYAIYRCKAYAYYALLLLLL